MENKKWNGRKGKHKQSYFGGFEHQKNSFIKKQSEKFTRSKFRMKIKTIKLSMEKLQNQEKQNMQTFLRAARKRGTTMAINEYLEKLDVENLQENEKGIKNSLTKEILTFNDLENLDLDFEEEKEAITEDEKLIKNKCLINPNGKFKIIWDHIQLVLILYTATLFPLKLGYFETGDYKTWDLVDYFIDFLFFLDLIMNFFLPFYRKNVLILDHSTIAFRYIKLWFWVDLLSIFPFELVFSKDSEFFETLAKLSKTPRIYRIFRLGRLIRTFKAGMKSDTLVVQYILFLIRSEKIFVSIAPIYIFGLIISHIFACVWHYNSAKSFDSRTWLLRHGYYSESTHDRFWASLYFVYSTVTTTGYGDILPDTNLEFLQTLIFMFCGVIFYSFVYSSIVSKFTDSAERNDKYHDKLSMLKELKRKKLFAGEKYLYREIHFLLDMYREFGMKNEKIPPFFNVRPSDRSKLLLEVCKKKFYFGRIGFFKSIPQYLWLYFFENMREMVYNPGEIIFERGAVSDFFYVIARGSVYFMMSNEELKIYPFIETSSYFGEIELFENSTRMWTVKANSKVILYTLPKNEFFKFLTDPRIRAAFFEESSTRMKKLGKAQRECGRALRRVQRAQNKVKKFIEKNKESIKKTIDQSKKKSKKFWHEHLGELNDDFQTRKLEEKRKEQTKALLKKLQEAEAQNLKDDTLFFKQLNGGKGPKRVVLGRRRKNNIVHPKIKKSKKSKSKRGMRGTSSPLFKKRFDIKKKKG